MRWSPRSLSSRLAGLLPALLVGSFASDSLQRVHADDPAESDDSATLAAIEELGGSVRRLGPDSEELEVEFHLRGRQLTDEGLGHVAALEHVVSLNLRGTKVTDAGLSRLSGLEDLRRLHLERTSVGDEGIEHLAGLVELEYLNLYATRTTDDGLRALEGLERLERLYVWQTGVTEEGAERLESKLPNLEVVLGVDLSELPEYSEEQTEPPEPTETLEWMAVADAKDVPKSESGLNTQVFFENRSGGPVKLYWMSYAGKPELYAELAPGATRQQNSYSRNTWLITNDSDEALGYFLVGTEIARAVIPKQEEGERP